MIAFKTLTHFLVGYVSLVTGLIGVPTYYSGKVCRISFGYVLSASFVLVLLKWALVAEATLKPLMASLI